MTHELNPDDNPSIRDAIKEYEDRTLLRATKATPLDVFAPQGILTTLGPVHAITYTGTLQGDTALYEHTFEGPAGPLLVVDETNAIHLVGGQYHVSDLGIEDGHGHGSRSNPWGFASMDMRKKHGRKTIYVDGEKTTVARLLDDQDPRDPDIHRSITEALNRLDFAAKGAKRKDQWASVGWQIISLTTDPNAPDHTMDECEDAGCPIHGIDAMPWRWAEDAAANPAFSKAPLGEGGRFAACVAKVSRQPGVYDPEGLCASIGRKKYGAKKMAAMAKAGRRNPADPTLPLFEEGERVELLADVERFPHFIAKAGSTGTVTQSEPDHLTVKMHLPLPGAEEWENEIVWTGDDAYHGDMPPLGLLGKGSPSQPAWLTLQSAYVDASTAANSLMRVASFMAKSHPDRARESHEAAANALMITISFIGDVQDRSSWFKEWQRIQDAMKFYDDHGYWSDPPEDNPISSSNARRREHAATTAEERHHWRRKKGEAMRRGNPVVTNRISPNSPIENAGVLAMAMPGGGPYGLPQVNAGALAAAPNYPGDYDFPGVTNGSHGLLGPQIRRNVPGQPIANPAIKADGKWHRLQASRGPGSGLSYLLDAGDVWAEIGKYQPRKYPTSRSLASDYLDWHGQELPANAPWVAIGYIGSLRQTLRGAPSNPPESVTSHKTLKAAKRAAEKALKGIRAR